MQPKPSSTNQVRDSSERLRRCPREKVTYQKNRLFLRKFRVTYFLTDCERFHDQLKFPLRLQNEAEKKSKKQKTKKDPQTLFGLERMDEDLPEIKFDNAFFNQNKVVVHFFS